MIDIIGHGDTYTILYDDKIIYSSGCSADLGYIIQQNRKSKAFSDFRGKVEALVDEPNFDKIANNIKVKFREVIPSYDNQEPEEEEIKKDLDIKVWRQLEEVVENNLYGRAEDIKLLLSVIVSYWYADKDCIYLVMVAPRSSGKTTLAECFENCDHVHTTDDVTMESFAPGTASPDDDVHGLLDECKDKTLMIHDLTPILTSRDDKVDRFFGMLEGSYGVRAYRKHSPGLGTYDYGGGYNFIFGCTPQIFKSKYKKFMELGRCLFFKPQILDYISLIKDRKTHIKPERVNEAILGFLENIEIKEIEVPQEVLDYSAAFFLEWMQYKLVWKEGESYVKKHYEPEPPIRNHNQLMMLCKAKCLIEGRNKIRVEDFKYFRKLLWGLDTHEERKNKIAVIDPDDIRLKEFFDI